MTTKLYRNLPKDQVDEQKANFLAALPFRKNLTRVLKEELESIHAAMRNDMLYEAANWELYQADRLGQEKAIRRILSAVEQKVE